MNDAQWIELLTDVSLVGIWVGAIAYGLFVIGYAWYARRVWWRVPAGRALIVSSASSFLLLGLSLLFREVEPSPLVGAAIVAGIIWVIALGGLLKNGALLHEMWHHRRSVPPTR